MYFAHNKTGKLQTITHILHIFLLHIIISMHIRLHIFRLFQLYVSLNLCVLLPNHTTISGPLFELIDPNNIQKTQF